MKHQYPLLLLGLVAYIFLPSFWQWMMDPRVAWYKPYVVWALLIIVTYIIQRRKSTS